MEADRTGGGAVVTVPGLLLFAGFALVGPAAAFLVPSTLIQSLLTQATIYAIFALGVGILIRQNGMVSFGHAAFFGLPAYVIGAVLPLGLIPPELIIIGGLAATALMAFLVGLVIVRVHGIAFGMLTLAIGQAVYEAATRLRGLTGGHDGLSLDLPRFLFGLPLKTFQQPGSMLIVTWLVLALMLAVAFLFAKSRYGLLSEAIRDNEERVRFLGYRTLVPRALTFALSALVTAAGGVLFALYNAFVSPETVHWTASGSALIMAILGGASAPWGPVAGAFTYFFLKEAVGSFTTHWLSIIGVSLIVVTVVFPAGLVGLFDRLRPGNRSQGAANVG